MLNDARNPLERMTLVSVDSLTLKSSWLVLHSKFQYISQTASKLECHCRFFRCWFHFHGIVFCTHSCIFCLVSTMRLIPGVCGCTDFFCTFVYFSWRNKCEAETCFPTLTYWQLHYPLLSQSPPPAPSPQSRLVRVIKQGGFLELTSMPVSWLFNRVPNGNNNWVLHLLHYSKVHDR